MTRAILVAVVMAVVGCGGESDGTTTSAEAAACESSMRSRCESEALEMKTPEQISGVWTEIVNFGRGPDYCACCMRPTTPYPDGSPSFCWIDN